jgi:hypothetical protein
MVLYYNIFFFEEILFFFYSSFAQQKQRFDQTLKYFELQTKKRNKFTTTRQGITLLLLLLK